MLDSAYRHFPSIPRGAVTLQTNHLDVCGGHYDATSSPDDQSAPSQVDSSENDDKITIKVIFPSGKTQTTKVSREMRVDKLVADASLLGRCPTNAMVIKSEPGAWSGEVMLADRSIGSYNIKNGDSIEILPGILRTKKPVIYLYSPSDIDVSVKLSLIPEWTLSVIYPVITAEDNGQRLEWNIRTHQDGSLTEHNSGLDVSYLFWEADFWLPYILKHEYIALRFIPQSAYERAASLSISPQPDIVTRVFMLFRGISKEHLANWSNAQMQAEKDVTWWVDVVGVDVARAGDAALFRVLEWGGMEVFI
ncbi:hypothetical protein BDR04DRAFT_1226288 [Suillus decipiens]|nr:hypothetical protein BDR04DRAFT_1226288 [Suillus decipiens]